MNLPGQFRDVAFLWVMLLWWTFTVFVETKEGQQDLLWYYGVFPAILGTVAVTVSKFIIPAKITKLLLVGVSIYGIRISAVFVRQVIASNYSNIIAGVYNDLVWAGPGAFATFIDSASIGIIAMTHVAVEAYRRRWGNTLKTHAWLLACLLVPVVFYPLFLILETPSGQAQNSDEKTLNDTEGVLESTGSWPVWIFAAEAAVGLAVWGIPIVEMYRTCGQQRWQPSNFAACGLNSTNPSQYSTNIVIAGMVFVFFGPAAKRIGTLRGGFLFATFLTFWIADLLFFNVASAMGVILALTFVDIPARGSKNN